MDIFNYGKFWLILVVTVVIISGVIIFLTWKQSIRLSERQSKLLMTAPAIILLIMIGFTVKGLMNLNDTLKAEEEKIMDLEKKYDAAVDQLEDTHQQLKQVQIARDSIEKSYAALKQMLDSVIRNGNENSLKYNARAGELNQQIKSLNRELDRLHTVASKSDRLSDSLRKQVVPQVEKIPNTLLRDQIAKLIKANDSLVKENKVRSAVTNYLQMAIREERAGDDAKSLKDKLIHYSNSVYHYRLAHIPVKDYKKVNDFVDRHM